MWCILFCTSSCCFDSSTYLLMVIFTSLQQTSYNLWFSSLFFSSDEFVYLDGTKATSSFMCNQSCVLHFPLIVHALQVFHVVSLFSSSSSYLWLSSQVYNNLLTISDFPPSSSVLMNLFTLMERKQLHLLCAISHLYSTSPVKVHALQVFHVASLFSSLFCNLFLFQFSFFLFSLFFVVSLVMVFYSFMFCWFG